MVFIHGGGFAMGSNDWPQYDQSRLVKLSIDVGLPFIGVTVKYVLTQLSSLRSAANHLFQLSSWRSRLPDI